MIFYCLFVCLLLKETCSMSAGSEITSKESLINKTKLSQQGAIS